MRYHSEHAPRHTKASAHTGNKMRNMKHQLLGWVLIACLVCTTVALPTQRTEAFVSGVNNVPKAVELAKHTPKVIQSVQLMITTVAAKISGDKITEGMHWQACVKSFGNNICKNVNPVSATVSAFTVASMIVSDTCKGMDVVTCGKKLWEKLSKFMREVLNKSKVKNGGLIIDRLQKCFSSGTCEQKDWETAIQTFEKSTPSKTIIAPRSQKPTTTSTPPNTTTTTSTKSQTPPPQKKSQTGKSGQYPGIHSAAGKALFEQMEKRKKKLEIQAKRSDLLPGQVQQIKKELKLIDESKSTLLVMQRKMEADNKKSPTFSQIDNAQIQSQINVTQGTLNTLTKQTDKILGTWKNLGAGGALVKNPVIPVQGEKSATQETSTSTKQTNGFSADPKFPNRNLSNKLLDDAYPDSGMGLSNGKDPESDSVTPQYGDPSTRVERGTCVAMDNNTIVTHLLQSKDTMGNKYKITNLKLIETAYGLMLQGVLNGKAVFILPCVPIAGYNTFFVGTMAELQALLKSAQAQGKLRYGVKGNAADVIKKVTKPI